MMMDYEEERNNHNNASTMVKDDSTCYVEEDTEDFSTSSLSDCVDGGDKGGVLVAENPPSGVNAESAFVKKIARYLPGPISRRLHNCSKRSLDRCLFITLVLLGFITILSGVLSATVDRNESTPSASTSTSMRQNASDTMDPSLEVTSVPGLAWPFQQQYPTISPMNTKENTSAPGLAETDMPTNPLSVSDLVFEGEPTAKPSLRPLPTTSSPTTTAPAQITAPVTVTPDTKPTTKETISPTPAPEPTSQAPTSNPSSAPSNLITYHPGNLTHMEHGLLLSQGLRVRIIAQSGLPVRYNNGQNSSRVFHGRPDAGATFAESHLRPENKGGWVYVSNSEMRAQDPPGGLGNGGVGAITFDRDGNVIDYSMLLENTTWNCGGGRTPWDTWVSCEENPKNGQLYQISPFGLREPEVLTLGKDGGRFESFAYDVRDRKAPYYFVTEDSQKGALQRFSPASVDFSNNPWEMLHGNGTTDFLILKPNSKKNGKKTFRWSSNRSAAKNNAKKYYPHTEGIDSHNGLLFFVSKKFKQLYELDLDDMTYRNQSVTSGLFDGAPDQLVRIFNDQESDNEVTDNNNKDLLYFTEEDGRDAGKSTCSLFDLLHCV